MKKTTPVEGNQQATGIMAMFFAKGAISDELFLPFSVQMFEIKLGNYILTFGHKKLRKRQGDRYKSILTSTWSPVILHARP
jgi:hypothetical protein